MNRRQAAAHQSGSTMIEILVSLVLCAFGLLGYVAMQSRATTLEFESFQRSQALVLVDDMISRINANRAVSADYVSAALIGGGAMADCSGETGADLDICEWGNLLRGAAETRAGSSVGAMLNARGCITKTTGTEKRYLVSVAWTGTSTSGAPLNICGRGDGAFPDEKLRRVVSATVCIGKLTDAVTTYSQC